MRTSVVQFRKPSPRTGAQQARGAGAERARKKFLKFFPGGFYDPTYIAWERGYKEEAHRKWNELLGSDEFGALLKQKDYAGIASRAVGIESRTNLLFSFEKMALRDAVRDRNGSRLFAEGLYAFVYGDGEPQEKFEAWCEQVERLPRRQTRVLTWPVVTVFPFIATPKSHFFLKPNVTRIAAELWGFDFRYASRPNWETYSSLLGFAREVRRSVSDLRPRDMIDIQSFIWVLGSDEYD
jgi:hypothetical protein